MGKWELREDPKQMDRYFEDGGYVSMYNGNVVFDGEYVITGEDTVTLPLAGKRCGDRN